MPTAALVKQVLSLATFVILLVSLVAAGTSLGLLQANIPTLFVYEKACFFFLNYSQAISLIELEYPDFNSNAPTCKLSIASATIATICLALLTAFQLISVSFQINVKTLIANIIQVGFFVGSILFLFISMVVVSAGWRKTCDTFKNITKTQYHELVFKCNGQQPSYGLPYLPYLPNGGEFIGAAVCAALGILFTIVALVLFIVKQIRSKDDYKHLVQMSEEQIN
ncbi:PREDICTED: uncharacterized protein LOC109589388 [Amphimedon queenslandica]|uniref:MARVEL domain-containing protein n=1 Tax=Amphimedon queenslandica TaxID=400682 RepID=A0A1X7T843_AMPQE|nr:PREDICTED: uncharacterized protein LOC109589388 [Amphimedon queenslandica]|eukprot:XP_019861038.1 PREDICTED: uncharacterized protein LOC109589388 [Amphimedon queenslandica]